MTLHKLTTDILVKLGVAGVCFVCLGVPTVAQNDTPGASFKRIRVGDQPAGKLINIQILEQEAAAETAAKTKAQSEAPLEAEIKSKTATAKPDADLQDWFWDGVSPKLADAGAGRMDAAMAQLAHAPSYFHADVNHMRKLAGLFGRDILLASLGTDVSPAFLLAIIAVESAGKIDAVSSAGAQGLMQLIPDTAARFGVTDPNDPKQNIKGGATYIAWLLKNFNNDPLLALAGYNAGENSVTKYGGVPPYAETRAYIPKIAAAWQVAINLCQSPPRYVFEGCAFTVPHIPRPVAVTKNETTEASE